MEYQDDQPPEHTTDRTDEYGEQVDGYVVSQDEVSKEEEDQPNDPIDDEPPQEASAARQQEHDNYSHQDEYDYFHRAPYYTKTIAPET
jgi:hypothetical protein